LHQGCHGLSVLGGVVRVGLCPCFELKDGLCYRHAANAFNVESRVWRFSMALMWVRSLPVAA